MGIPAKVILNPHRLMGSPYREWTNCLYWRVISETFKHEEWETMTKLRAEYDRLYPLGSTLRSRAMFTKPQA